MFSKVGTLVSKFSAGPRASKTLLSMQVRQIARESLVKTLSDLPADLVQSISVVSYKNGTLTLSVSGLLAAELYGRSGSLIDAVNKALGKSLVVRLRFRN